MKRFLNVLAALALLVTGFGLGVNARFEPGAASAQGGCRTFQETGKTVCGRFLEYWQQNGGLAQQGLPLSGEFTEISDLNGQPYTVQYFERAVFEKHPENQPPYDVLLSQLGTFQFKKKYPNGDPSVGGQPVPPAPAPPTATPAPVAPPSGAQTFSGHGQQTTQGFQLKAGAARVNATHNGSDNFIVHLLDSKGNIAEFVVNVIGPANVSRVINVETAGLYYLDVEADGDWTISVQQ